MNLRIKVYRAWWGTFDEYSLPTHRTEKLYRDARQLRVKYPSKVFVVQEQVKDGTWVDKQELERA